MIDLDGAPARRRTLRRRFDNRLLRWQARLDSENADRFLPWVWTAVLFVVLVSLSLARARSLFNGVDLAVYTQASWLIGNGLEPTVTVEGNQHILSQQASFAFYPLAWVADWLPRIPTLLAGQSLALAVAVVPLWRLARNEARLRTGAAAAVLFAYSVYPAVHNLNVTDFHPEVLGIPALLWAIRFGLSRHRIGFALAVFVTVAARADLGLALAGFGILLAVEGRRLAGGITTVLSFGYLLMAVLVIQPEFSAENIYAHVASFDAYGDSPGGVLLGMLTHPGSVIGDLTIEANFQVFVFLFAPLFFLPVLAPRYLLPVVPLQCLYLIADVPFEDTFGTQTVAVTAFIFVATVFALRKIGRMGVERIIVDRRVLAALVLASTVYFISNAATSPYQEPWGWGGRTADDQARLDAVDRIGPTESVRVSAELTPLLAERRSVFLLDTLSRPDVRVATETPGQSPGMDPAERMLVDVIVIDSGSEILWSDDEMRVFREGLIRSGYEEVFSAEVIEVYRHQGIRAAEQVGASDRSSGE